MEQQNEKRPRRKVHRWAPPRSIVSAVVPKEVAEAIDFDADAEMVSRSEILRRLILREYEGRAPVPSS